MLVTQGLDLIAFAVFIIAAVFILHVFGDFHHILGIAALDQTVDVDNICRYVHAVPGNAARRFRAFCLGQTRYDFLVVRILADTTTAHRAFRRAAVQGRRVRANVHNAFGIILGHAALGGGQRHFLALHIDGADSDITRFVYNAYAAVIVGNIPHHFHIGNGSICVFVACAYLPDQKIISSQAVGSPIFVLHGDGACSVAGGITVEGKRRVIRRVLVGILVQIVDFAVPGIAAADAVALESDLAAVVPDAHFVQLQVGVGLVVDVNRRLAVGIQLALTVQVVGLDRDIAATDGDLRDFRVADGVAAGDIHPDRSAVSVIFIRVHMPFVHLIIDALALCHIAVVGGRVTAV